MKIQNRFLLTSLAVTLIVLTACSFAFLSQLKRSELRKLEDKILQTSSVMAEVLVEPVWLVDDDQVQRIIEAYFEQPELIRVALTGVPDSLLVTLGKSDTGIAGGKHIMQEMVITRDSDQLGVLELEFTTSQIEETILQLRSWLIVVAMLISLVLIGIFGRLSAAITTPIERLIAAFRKVDQGELDTTLKMEGHGEFQALEQYFNNMLTSLRDNKKRDALHREEIEQKHKDLQDEIGQRQKAEEALRHAQKLEAIGRLAGGVAHDFNNLLTAILGYAEIAELDLSPEHPARSSVHEICVAGERGRDLVEQLLAVGRKKPLSLETLPLADTLNGARMLIEKTMTAGVEFRLLPIDPRVTFVGDRSAVSQILLNLAANARDAMPEGGMISLSADMVGLEPSPEVPVPTAGEYVCLRFKDDGLGMTQDQVARIFEPFYSTKGDQGTGLGLAMVHSLVDQLQGTITVSSEAGVGTTFHIYFPRGDNRDLAPREVVAKPTRHYASGDILLVEDEVQVRTMFRKVLERNGYTVTSCDDGTAGLAHLRANEHSYVAVVSDVLMPRMTGPDMITLAKREGMLHCPVLFITGYGHDQVGNLLDEPDVYILHKPFMHDDLLRTLSEIVSSDEPETV